MTLPENGSDNVTLEFGELEFTLGFMSSVNGGPASEDESERRPLKCTGHVCACVDFFTWISFFHLYHDRCESAVCGFPQPLETPTSAGLQSIDCGQPQVR